jgi:hypothetical protein
MFAFIMQVGSTTLKGKHTHSQINAPDEVIICQEHVVLCIHITYHPQYDQTLELTTLVLIGTNNLCNQCLSVVCSIQHYVIKFVMQVCFVSVFLGVVTHWHIVF